MGNSQPADEPSRSNELQLPCPLAEACRRSSSSDRSGWDGVDIQNRVMTEFGAAMHIE